jgi:hypothetical protein
VAIHANNCKLTRFSQYLYLCLRKRPVLVEFQVSSNTASATFALELHD